jgi:DUF177 domain-containing protein
VAAGGSAFRVRLKDIGPDGLRLSLCLDPVFFRACLPETGADLGHARGEATMSLTRNGARVFVHGSVTARFDVPCGRCLEPAAVDIASPVEVTFVPAPLAPDRRETEISGDDPDYCPYRGEEIDFLDLIREQILLGTPYAPVCRDDCLGLCPRCGNDRNRAPCGCTPAEDPTQRLRL